MYHLRRTVAGRCLRKDLLIKRRGTEADIAQDYVIGCRMIVFQFFGSARLTSVR